MCNVQKDTEPFVIRRFRNEKGAKAEMRPGIF